MALYIQKFGGSSLANATRIRAVADIINTTRQQGHSVVVVVSAMQSETDRLIDLAKHLVREPDLREYDAMLATGEQVSAALLSMALVEKGCAACSYNASQVQIHTDSRHKKSKIIEINTEKLKQAINSGVVPVVTGFQGVDAAGNVTTLGRGGSDMTAVALAGYLQADECQIFTDVDGVYTTDPNVVREARRLPCITFDEMLALSDLGAKVLQIASVRYAHEHNVPLRVLSSYVPGSGTLITREEVTNLPKVSGIAFDRNQAKLTIMGMPKQADLARQVLSEVGSANIDIDMLIENVPTSEDHFDFSFTVPLDDYTRAKSITEKLAKDLTAKRVIGDDRIAKLSLVGLGMKSHAGVASKMFHTLGEKGIDIQLIMSSEVKISAVIDEAHMEAGAQALHMAFGLAEDLN